MKILENAKELNEVEMKAVAGGYDDNHTIFDTFVEWLIQLPTHYPEETPDDDRPLPVFPNLRDATHKHNNKTTVPQDFPYPEPPDYPFC